MGFQPFHEVTTGEIDGPEVFNKAGVSDLRSQYVGHVGHYWGAHAVKYNGGARPGDPAPGTSDGGDALTEQWKPEQVGFKTNTSNQDIETGSQRIALISHSHGQLWGDVVPGVQKPLNFLDGTPYVVPSNVQPSFFPDGSLLWPECQWGEVNPDVGAGETPFCGRSYNFQNRIPALTREDFEINNQTYAGTPGKVVMVRQRGNKLWVMHLISIGWSLGHHGDWNSVYGTSLRVANINEPVPPTGEEWFDTYSQRNFPNNNGKGIPMMGPPWEARWERFDIDDFGKDIGLDSQVIAASAPNLTPQIFGVGDDHLMYVNARTYHTPAEDSAQAAWSEDLRQVILINPYTGYAFRTTYNVGLGFFSPDPNQNQRPGHDLLPSEDPLHPINRKFAILPAPRDAPWCVGQNLNHSKVWVGTLRIHPSIWTPTNTDGLGAGGFGIGDTPDLVDLDEEGTPLAINSLAMSQEPPWSDEPDWSPEIEDAYQLAPINGDDTVEHIEVRGYDRLPANEVRGAIDCVIWHEGWRIWDETRRGLNGADPQTNMDPWKTQRTGNRTLPVTTGAYVWVRRQKLNDPLVNGVRQNSTYEIRDLYIEHSVNDPRGYDWIPLAVTITPFGDYVYILLSNQNDDHPESLPGRRWKIVRPNYWELETRLPDLGNQDVFSQPQFRFPSDVDYNRYGDFIYDENLMLNSSRGTGVKLTCNEHWLYISNMPARITPTHDLNRPDVIAVGSASGEGNYIEDAFTSPNLGFEPDGSNLGQPALDELPSFSSLQYSHNVSYEWSIDLNSGKIRIPWRTQYGDASNNFAGHSLYGSFYNFIPGFTNDIDINDLSFDVTHMNRVAFASTDTVPKVRGSTPTPTFH